MKISYETTLDDLIAFNRFHYANSPVWRRQVWIRSAAPVGILVVLLVLLVVLQRRMLAVDRDPMPMIMGGITFIAIAVASVLYTRWRLSTALVRNTRRLLREGSNRTVFGWRELELVDGRLIVNAELFRSSFDLRAIEKIVSTDDYAFVYISSVSALIIPMNLDAEAEHRDFVAELREAWENRGMPRAPADHSPRRPVDERITKR
jgi:hypothetical protein